jgi:CIC family chloride channel protein
MRHSATTIRSLFAPLTSRIPRNMPPTPLLTRAADLSKIGFGSLAMQVPQRLRMLVRSDEISLVVLAALLGAISGLLVVAMNQTTQLAHEWLYHLPAGQRLSAQPAIGGARALLVPCFGGLCVGLLTLALTRWMPRRAVDPIEANALYGGKMSMRDSVVVVAQTMLSNGVGASVGLEAGYTQIGSAVGDRHLLAGHAGAGGGIGDLGGDGAALDRR